MSQIGHGNSRRIALDWAASLADIIMTCFSRHETELKKGKSQIRERRLAIRWLKQAGAASGGGGAGLFPHAEKIYFHMLREDSARTS